jgi:hypothetical protein
MYRGSQFYSSLTTWKVSVGALGGLAGVLVLLNDDTRSR